MPNDLNDPPLNMPANGDITALLVLDTGIVSLAGDPLVGTITFVTKDGHYAFLINETIANQIIQEARAFLRGDSSPLIDEPD